MLAEFGVDATQNWYHVCDFPPFVEEMLIPETWAFDEAVEHMVSNLQTS